MDGAENDGWSRSPASAKKGFLILGPQRSGTSLTARILNQHPKIAVPPESLFFNTMIPLRRYYGDLSLTRNVHRLIDDVLRMPKVLHWSPTPTRAQVLKHLVHPSLGGVFIALMEAWAEAERKPRWGEKSPHHVLFWSDIRSALPGVSVLLVIRDGRDVALSLRAARFGPKSVARAAHRWVRWMKGIEVVQKDLPAHRIHIMRYEDLTTEPETTLRKVCHFLGENFHRDLMSFHESRTTYSSYSLEHVNLQRPLMQENLGKWWFEMQPRELAVYQDIAGQTLERWGYKTDRERAKANGLERIFERWLVEPIRKPVALARNRVGHREEFDLLMLRLRLIRDYLLGRVGSDSPRPFRDRPRSRSAGPAATRAGPARPFR